MAYIYAPREKFINDTVYQAYLERKIQELYTGYIQEHMCGRTDRLANYGNFYDKQMKSVRHQERKRAAKLKKEAKLAKASRPKKPPLTLEDLKMKQKLYQKAYRERKRTEKQAAAREILLSSVIDINKNTCSEGTESPL